MTHAPSSPTHFAKELHAKASEILHDLRNHATALPLPRIRSAPSSPAKSAYDPHDLSLDGRAVRYEDNEVSWKDEQTLIRAFLRHAPQLGFFLSPNHFAHARMAAEPANVAFMNTVYLWGSRFSIWQLRDRAELFVDRAERAADDVARNLGSVASSSASGHATVAALRTIQAGVLLANYYFSMGRLEDGKRHWKECVRLVRAYELHALSENSLDRGAAAVATGEKIRAFWTVVALDNTWAGATNGTTSIFRNPEIQVTTPWPLPVQAYEDGNVIDPQHERSSYSMEQFVGGIVNDAGEVYSPLGIKVKASALYAEACGLLFRCPAAGYEARVEVLDTIVAAFYERIAGAHLTHGCGPDDLRDLLVARTLLCAAFVQLHTPLMVWRAKSQERFDQATAEAAATLDIIDLNKYRYIDPVMASVWLSICKALAEEVKKARKTGGFPDPTRVVAPCNKITGAMETLVPSSPAMRLCLDQFTEATK